MYFQGFCRKVTNTLLVQVYFSDSTWNSEKSCKTQWILFWSQKKKKKKKISQGIQKTFDQTQGFFYSVVESRIPSNNFFSLISSFFMQSLSCWKALFRLALNLYAFTSQSWSQKAFFLKKSFLGWKLQTKFGKYREPLLYPILVS